VLQPRSLGGRRAGTGRQGPGAGSSDRGPELLRLLSLGESNGSARVQRALVKMRCPVLLQGELPMAHLSNEHWAAEKTGRDVVSSGTGYSVP